MMHSDHPTHIRQAIARALEALAALSPEPPKPAPAQWKLGLLNGEIALLPTECLTIGHHDCP